MQTRQKSTLLANTFGTLGYFSCLLLWAWVTMLYLPIILGNEQVRGLLIPSGEKAIPTPSLGIASPITITFAIALTVIIMAVTVFVLLRVPVTIAKTGKAVTTKAAGSLEPLVAHGRPLPPKEKQRLTASLIKLIKLLMMLIPVATGLLGVFVPLALPFDMVVLVSSMLAILAVFWFSAQYILADILGIKPERLV